MNDSDIIIETFTELAPRYEEVIDSELNRFWGWSYEGFVNKLFEMTPILENDIILDVATGTGVIPDKLVRERLTRNRVHGLDITMSMLVRAKRRFVGNNIQQRIDLVCASAMGMPYSNASFSVVICGLATHHMDGKKLISEMHRILLDGGVLSIADVGGSPTWRLPGVKWLIRLAAFIYFLVVENINRGWAEARAVSNVRTKEEWNAILTKSGFKDIIITKLKSRYIWVPEPLVIKAIKIKEDENDKVA